jgi:serine protease
MGRTGRPWKDSDQMADEPRSAATPAGRRHRGHEYRVGALSAAAVMLAATVGTLASAPAQTGYEAPEPIEVTRIEPRWADGLDHVVVMTDRAALVQPASPALPAPVIVGPTLLDTGITPVDMPPDEVVRSALEAVPGVESVEVVAPGTFAVATAGERDDLLSVPGVAELFEDHLFAPVDDPDQGRQWALRNTGAPEQAGGWPGVAGADANVPEAWRVSEGAGVTVAVVDTGVDPNHPDLTGRLWSNTDEVCGNGADDDANGYVDDCRGWDFAMGDSDPGDDRGRPSSDHGTHVAGIIAAGRNGVGIAGVAPQATIMPVKVSRSSDGLFPGSAIAAGIIYAVDNGARVINMSFGTGSGIPRSSMALQERAIQYAISMGATLVAAAGNSAVDIGVSPVWPAGFSTFYPGLITVGATTNSDTRASFSCFGSPVNIYAPGQMILSTLPASGYGFKSGTSMATPAVAGAAAAVIASGAATSPAAVRERLVSTARAGAAGKYLDVGAAVGSAAVPSIQVQYEGAHTMRADTTGRMAVRVSATTLPAGVSAVRVSVATNDGGAVYAVDGLPVQVLTPGGGVVQSVTGADGGLAAVPLGPTTQIAPSEWRFELSTSLPEGMYAVVTELVDLAGAPLGGAFVGFVLVTTAPPPGVTVPITTVPITTVPITTVPAPSPSVPVTSLPGPITTAPAPTTPIAPAPTWPAPTPSTTPAPAPAPSPTWPAPSPTVPVPTTTVAPAPTWPAPPPTSPVPAPTVPAPTPTSPSPTPTTAPAPSPAPPAPTPTTPPTTAPEPEPDKSANWRLDSMSPRLSTTLGGTPLQIDGRFPTNVPVYVWFGDMGVVEANSFGNRLTLLSPAVARTGVVDIVVRFTTSQSHVMTLAEAFTFVAPSTAPPTPVSPSPDAPGTTLPAPTPTAPPVVTSPPTPPPVVTSPAPAPAPTTTVVTPTPPTTVAPVPTSTAPVPVRTRGSLRLQTLPATGSIGRLAAAPWPWPGGGCETDNCSTVPL